MHKKNIKILTNHPGQDCSPTWKAMTTYMPVRGNSYYASLVLAIRLYKRRIDYDCVVLGGGRSDFFFACLQALLPFKRTPCIFIDCLWSKSHNMVLHLFHKLIRKIAARTVHAFIVWARHEQEVFSRIFDIPREKFVFVPYHTTNVESYTQKPRNEGYIFSGGNSDRDYRALIEAVRELPVKLYIATANDVAFDGPLPENVDIQKYTPEAYLKKMANCGINVVALAPGLIRSAGQQTFLNSMFLKKPTIVTDPKGAVDYIQDHENGLIVPPNDAAAIRKAILTILNDPDKARRMGERAAETALLYSTEEHFKKIVAVVQEVILR